MKGDNVHVALAEQKGVLATDMILKLIRNETIEQRNIVLPVSLVERGSVKQIV